ncbi:MAG: C40 family peptidase [Burkholderiaceae bacterium]
MNKVCGNQDQLCNESASAPPNSGLACSQRRLFGLLSLAGLTSLVSGCAGLGSLSSGPSRRGSDLPLARLEANGQAGLAEPALHAFSLVGTPYRWGGNTPKGGFDCSGLVVYVMRRSLGTTLPRTVEQMSNAGYEIAWEDRLPGDLVFFNTTGGDFSHVGIYIGQNRFVHAPRAGGTVRLETLVSSYWGPRITAFRRVASESHARTER